jgi:hypothetical protein
MSNKTETYENVWFCWLLKHLLFSKGIDSSEGCLRILSWKCRNVSNQLQLSTWTLSWLVGLKFFLEFLSRMRGSPGKLQVSKSTPSKNTAVRHFPDRSSVKRSSATLLKSSKFVQQSTVVVWWFLQLFLVWTHKSSPTIWYFSGDLQLKTWTRKSSVNWIQSSYGAMEPLELGWSSWSLILKTWIQIDELKHFKTIWSSSLMVESTKTPNPRL